MRFSAGDAVQTPLGKGVVREVRNNGRLLVDVHGRALVLKEAEVSARDPSPGSAKPANTTATTPTDASRSASLEVDLHGLTVAEALARVESALNDALLTDRSELRFIHGRRGGRIRVALHQQLREIPSVRHFQLDPANHGVTIVRL